MPANWLLFVTLVLVLTVASLGVGFLIAAVPGSDSQAIPLAFTAASVSRAAPSARPIGPMARLSHGLNIASSRVGGHGRPIASEERPRRRAAHGAAWSCGALVQAHATTPVRAGRR